MRLAPLTQDEAAKARWHVRAYGQIEDLANGWTTEEAIREGIADCPEQYREHYRHWLNVYRQKFKEARCKKRDGADTGACWQG